MINFNITIVKNDDFKTVGFHVYAEKEQIFSWGCASDMYYNKKITAKPEHMDKVMELVKTQAELHSLNLQSKIGLTSQGKMGLTQIAVTSSPRLRKRQTT